MAVSSLTHADADEVAGQMALRWRPQASTGKYEVGVFQVAHRCSAVRPCTMTAAAPASCSSETTCCTLILEAEVPVRTFTVSGRSMPSAMPATSRASFLGLRSSADPSPRFVASATGKSWHCNGWSPPSNKGLACHCQRWGPLQMRAIAQQRRPQSALCRLCNRQVVAQSLSLS